MCCLGGMVGLGGMRCMGGMGGVCCMSGKRGMGSIKHSALWLWCSCGPQYHHLLCCCRRWRGGPAVATSTRSSGNATGADFFCGQMPSPTQPPSVLVSKPGNSTKHSASRRTVIRHHPHRRHSRRGPDNGPLAVVRRAHVMLVILTTAIAAPFQRVEPEWLGPHQLLL